MATLIDALPFFVHEGFGNFLQLFGRKLAKYLEQAVVELARLESLTEDFSRVASTYRCMSHSWTRERL